MLTSLTIKQLVFFMLVIPFFGTVEPMEAGKTPSQTIRIPVNFESYNLEQTATGTKVRIKDFGRLSQPGEPYLPSRILSIAIPPGMEFTGFWYESGQEIILPGQFDVCPVMQQKIPKGDPPLDVQISFDANYAAIYQSSEAYPNDIVEFVRTSGYREYNLVDLKVTPFRYKPDSRQLMYYPEIVIHLNCRPHGKKPRAYGFSSPRIQDTARGIIFNFDQAGSWYETDITAERGLYDFVLITLENLTDSVKPLVDWERAKGRTPKVVTLSWIEANYEGYDSAARIRRFLREKYPASAWGIEDLLIVGHPQDVPMRLTSATRSTGRPAETDFYYAELSLPDEESWDSDHDHYYGEISDPIDYYGEINVGRIPWSDPRGVRCISEKSAAYERNTDPAFKNNILLLGAIVDDVTDGAVFQEYVANQTIHPWMEHWAKTRMYEPQSPFPMDCPLTHDNVLSVWSSGKYGVVSWHSHGSPHGAYVGGEAYITSADCSSLNDDYPAIISSAACSNSDTDYVSIGQSMLRQGAVGFLGANKSAWYMGAWDNPLDGSDQSFKYYFLSRITSGEDTQGQALQYAIREMYARGLWDSPLIETFLHSSLFGNPNLGIMSHFESHSPEVPSVAAGPSRSQTGIECTYSSSSVDPDLDQIYYCWFWGDGSADWLGPYTQGEPVEARHSWLAPGIYTVKVKARDVHGAESPWSAPLTVAIQVKKGGKGRR
jgi:hypothetical protein